MPESTHEDGPQPEISDAPITLNELLARCLNKTPVALRVLEAFAADAPGTIGQLRGAIEAGDAPSVAAAAHKIKGSAANLAAEKIRDAAYELEMCGRAGNLEAAPRLLARLEAEVERCNHFLPQAQRVLTQRN
jgi:HPt (histidine-containing phosphotransfer) domain-containing protein